ncbi:MAG TPA: efflux RND transporter periplasmic adaptor subunit [Magnetospirillaceae bacterium]|nr:efflux RND transporter periplasmic adaptor subunit [Magnetospirillaceae bacterium]
MRKVLVLTLIGALAAPGARAEEEKAAAGTVAVELAPLKKQTVKASLAAYGTVAPDTDSLVSVSYNKAGQVARVLVRAGQPVEKGTPLVEFVTDPAAMAGYRKAESGVTFARGELDRTRALLGQHLATNSQLASAEQALRDAESALEAERGAGTGKGSETLTAPFAGYVDSLAVVLGDRIQPGAAIARLGRGAGVKVMVGAEPAEAGEISTGMDAEVTPLAGHGQPVAGKVVAVAGMVNASTRLIDVTISVPGGILPGTAVRAELSAEGHEALVVPRNAVLRDEEGVYIYQVKDDKAVRVEVETGIETDALTEISGDELKTDLPVVVVGNYELSDGAAVKVSRTR